MPEQHSGKRGQSMDYKLVISEHADELLDNLVYYLLYRLKSEQMILISPNSGELEIEISYMGNWKNFPYSSEYREVLFDIMVFVTIFKLKRTYFLKRRKIFN